MFSSPLDLIGDSLNMLHYIFVLDQSRGCIAGIGRILQTIEIIQTDNDDP